MKEEPSIIIIRNIKPHRHHHKGGSWKIAFADFTSSMMVLFLLLWLIANIDKEKLTAITKYFSITKIEDLKINNDNEITSEKYNDSDTTSENEKEELLFQNLEQTINKISANILIKNTDNELNIEIIDIPGKEYFLFKPGTSELQKPAMEVLRKIAHILRRINKYISVSGHTTKLEENFNPWNLSINRANVVREFLIKSGLLTDQVVQVIGKANVYPLNSYNPYAIQNRRITITLKSKNLPPQLTNIPS